MDDAELISTDTRPRSKKTGYAFGFEGNYGMVAAASALVSILLLTLLMYQPLSWPGRIIIAMFPCGATLAYLVAFKRGKPPRYDLDLLKSLPFMGGNYFRPTRLQPIHPQLLPLYLANKELRCSAH
jgi:hypothetical protein